MRSRLAALPFVALVVVSLGPLAPAAPPGEWRPDATKARDYLERRAGDVSFAIRFRGADRRHHGERPTAARSVVKVMLMAAYLRSRGVRDRELRGEEKDLLRPMIRFSNNRAANEMAARVSPGELYRLARAAGMRRFRYELPYWGNSTTSAADQVRLMHRLDRLVPERHVPYARHLMHSITDRQRWGVAEVKPAGWRLHFKSGWGSGTGETENQIAFLTRHGCRVSLAIFAVRSPSADYGRITQREVARRLLDGLSRDTCRGRG